LNDVTTMLSGALRRQSVRAGPRAQRPRDRPL